MPGWRPETVNLALRPIRGAEHWWGRNSWLPFDRLTAWFDRLTTLSRSTFLTALSFYRMGNVEGLSEVEGPIVARQPVGSLWVERESLAHHGPAWADKNVCPTTSVVAATPNQQVSCLISETLC